MNDIIKQGKTEHELSPLAFAPKSFDELIRFSEVVCKTNLCPQAYRGKVHEAVAAIMHGAELGLMPMQALNSVAVVNGQTTVYGPTALALVKNQWLWDESKHQEYFRIHDEEVKIGDLGPAENWHVELTAVCVMGRRDGAPQEGSFSVGQAKDAGLWSRQSKGGQSMPWSAYPSDMLMWKARARAMRSVFPGALRGLGVMQDLQGETIDITPQKPEPAAIEAPKKGTEGLKAKVRQAKAGGSDLGQAKAPDPPVPLTPQTIFDAEVWNKRLNELYKAKASKVEFRNLMADAQRDCTDKDVLELCTERWGKALDVLEADA